MNATSSLGRQKHVLTVISGGQTGVDRGALDAAIALGVPHAGKCPRGRLAEDGVIPALYSQLEELFSPEYSVRTEQNVLDADATLILYQGELMGGTAYTQRMAIQHRKRFYLYDFTDPPGLDDLISWCKDVHLLNCAGPRESSCPGIASLARKLCQELFSRLIDDRRDM